MAAAGPSVVSYALERDTLFLVEAWDVADVHRGVEALLARFESLLPADRDRVVLLKPNLNNDLCALTGNSTDLRLLSGLVLALQRRGYTDIVIGDGPNVGTYNQRLDVLGRLRIPRLAEALGVRWLDFNRAPPAEIEVGGRAVAVPRLLAERPFASLEDRPFFINVPTIKTHVEAGLSAATKNLMGCVRGMDKRQLHWDLPRGLVALAECLKPDLHIVDGLVVMEGDGPGRGTPRRLGVLAAGRDSLLLDALCARLVGLERRRIPYLALALRDGLVAAADLARLDALVAPRFRARPARLSLWARLLLNNLFIYPRYWRAFDWLFRSPLVSAPLVALGLRQDVYAADDGHIASLRLTPTDACRRLDSASADCSPEAQAGARRCEAVCPMALPILSEPSALGGERCLSCLYCYLVCPHDAITVGGDLGYLKGHLARYKALIEAL